ncbi:TetR/AcrR family transcriptional regulator [Spirillospora sp. CA-255316]
MIDAQYRGADPGEGGGTSGSTSGGASDPGTAGTTGTGTNNTGTGTTGANDTGTGGGGTRRERRERTRAALLGAAQRLWAERGVHGASLDDVAAEAGLTKGAVYSNFTGKTDLLLALLERWTGAGIGTETYTELTDAEPAGAEPAGNSRSPEERFERAGHAYARRMSGEGARLLALLLVEFWLYGMRDGRAGERLSDWYAERRAGLAEDLRDTDGITATDRAALAVALDFGLAMQHLLDPDRVPAELYAHGMRLVLGRAVA